MPTLLRDKFTGANGTALADHVPIVGGPWTSSDLGLVIQSNKLTGSDALGISSAPMLTRTCRARLTFDLNAASANSKFNVQMSDTTLDNYLWFELKVDGYLQVKVSSPDDDYLSTTYVPPGSFAGPHVLDMHISASSVRVAIDGRLVVECPRTILLATVLTLFQLKLEIEPGLYPKISDLLVTN